MSVMCGMPYRDLFCLYLFRTLTAENLTAEKFCEVNNIYAAYGRFIII